MQLNIFERALPAWHGEDCGPQFWAVPEGVLENDWGNEPSNIRTSAVPHRDTLENCLRLQCAVAAAQARAASLSGPAREEDTTVRYVFPTLAREEYALPGPAGGAVGGRLVLITPGRSYQVSGAAEAALETARNAFDCLLAGAQPDS